MEMTDEERCALRVLNEEVLRLQRESKVKIETLQDAFGRRAEEIARRLNMDLSRQIYFDGPSGELRYQDNVETIGAPDGNGSPPRKSDDEEGESEGMSEPSGAEMLSFEAKKKMHEQNVARTSKRKGG